MAPFRQGLYVKQGSTSVLGSSVGKDTDREETAGEGHSGVDIVDSVVAGSVVEDTVVNVVVGDSVVVAKSMEPFIRQVGTPWAFCSFVFI